MELNAKLDLRKIIDSDNVAELLSDDDLARIGLDVSDGFQTDKDSRSEWETRNATAMELALQVTSPKTFPWPGASNAKLPIITMAATQYHARAYPAIIASQQVVGCLVLGDDPDGQKAARAKRVGDHMSFQLMEEYPEWEEGMDKLLLVHAIVGCAFKKTYYDPIRDIKVSELVFPSDLVVDYYTKSLSTATRITHIVEMSHNDIVERQRAGTFREVTLVPQDGQLLDGPIKTARDARQGLQEGGDDSSPYTLLEQHRWLDLDGDGYEEPYIVTVELNTSEVFRIVPRFNMESVKWKKEGKHVELVGIKAWDFFTKYPFIPAPDGGFYDLGFGRLLGAVNDTVDTLVNQLVDAGTMATTGGGFLGRGARLKSGDNTFKPGEWKRVDVSGEDLSKNIVKLPVGEPSPTLFQLLNLMLDLGSKLGGITDPMVGENPGQNTPAETSRNTIAQGQKVFNAIYKRVYRSMKEEFRKLYRLNYLFPPANGRYDYNTSGRNGSATVADYFASEKGVVPTADPFIASDEQRQQQANDLVSLMSGNSPFAPMLSAKEILSRVLDSRRVSNQQALLNTQPPPPAPPPYQVQVAQMQAQTAANKLQYEYTKLLALVTQEATENLAEQTLNAAKIDNLNSQAALFMKQAEGQADNAQIAMIDAQIGAAKLQSEHLQARQTAIDARRDSLMQFLQASHNAKMDVHSANMDVLDHVRQVNKDANDAELARQQIESDRLGRVAQ